MNLKFGISLIGLSTLVVVQTNPLVGQQIPPNELPSPGTDTGLEGKYDAQNGIAQLILDKSSREWGQTSTFKIRLGRRTNAWSSNGSRGPISPARSNK